MSDQVHIRLSRICLVILIIILIGSSVTLHLKFIEQLYPMFMVYILWVATISIIAILFAWQFKTIDCKIRLFGYCSFMIVGLITVITIDTMAGFALTVAEKNTNLG